MILARAHEELAVLLAEHFEDAGTQHRLQPVAPPEVMVPYLVSALLGLLTLWLDGEMPHTPEEMSRSFGQLTHTGVESTFGR